jgi:hypothetical protein
MFYGVTGMDMRKLTFDFAEVNHIQHPFSHEKKMASPDLLSYFIKSSNLSLRIPETTSMTRVTGFTRPKEMGFCEIYKSIRDKHEITEEGIFNIDETVQKPKKIVAQRGMKQVVSITSAERGNNITVVGTVSATGTFIPP